MFKKRIKKKDNDVKEKKDNDEYLKYSFINNSILLTTEKIIRNGFYEVWRQENIKSHSIQILCFNPETNEFQAFDRFHWSDEPRIVANYPYYKEGIAVDFLEPSGVYYKRDLWTPIKLHYTLDWLKEHLVSSLN